MPSPIVGRGKPSRPYCPGLKRLLVVVLDQSRTGNAKGAGTLHCVFDQLFVGEAIERTDVTDFAAIDDEAEYFGLCHRSLPCARRLLPFDRIKSRFFQLGQNAIACVLYLLTQLGVRP